MYKILILCLFIILNEWQINGQAIITGQCQSQTSTVNDLLMKIRQLENDYSSLRKLETDYETLRQQYMDSENRLMEIEDKQKRLDDELREMKDQISDINSLQNETDGKKSYYHFPIKMEFIQN